MSKKFTDAKLCEIALMTSKGLSVDQIAERSGLQAKSVAHLVWIYRWSPEKVEEMTERSKIHGPKGEGPRSRLRKYFIMHPEQHPAPQQKPSDQPEPVEVKVVDSNARERLDLLWKFSTAQNERLIEVEHRLDVPDKLADNLTDQFISLTGRVDELERKAAVMHRDFDEHHGELMKFANSTLDRLAKCERQITHLQDVLVKLAEVLPREYA